MLSFDVLFLNLHSFRLLLDNKIDSELFSKPSQAIRNVDFQMIRWQIRLSSRGLFCQEEVVAWRLT